MLGSFFYLCLCLASISVSVFGLKLDDLVVCPPNVGCLRGTYMKGYQVEKFQAFMGIPYALPPLGELRFSNPKVMPKLSGIYNASLAKSDCIQKNYLLPTPIIYGEEDCLYLNVYRPERISKLRLPVMVYIHGGGFFSGSAGPSVTGPEYFMDTGEVIVVTMAYRLGALGFLSTQDANIPGNFGLKDQNLALRWVRNNIAFFGGNPQRVTIFGQSVGGVSTHLHLLSPKSQGLFQAVISMSGTANVPFAVNSKPLEQARKTAEFCQIEGADNLSTAKLARALRNIDVYTLINAGDGLKFWDVDHMTNYRPVIEPVGKEAFLTIHPNKLLAKGGYRKVPWLLGTVPEEGAVRVVNIKENITLREDFNSKFDYLLQELMEWPSEFNAQQLKEKTKILIDEFFGGIHEINDKTVQGFLDLITVRGFKQPLYNAITDYVRSVDTNKYPFYMYSFNYKGPVSYASIYTQANVTGKYGVVHCDDLIYLFRSPILFPDFAKNSTEAKVIKTFVRYFINFAKFGKPQNVPPLSCCTEEILKSRPEGICDYHEFINNKQNTEGFEIRVNDKFPTNRVKIWSNLLEEMKNF
ncbi:uncharacterized protein Dwil_GK21864 [Drosophila willistoni]|uniref:carboxylesterase n=1 Tax=Drosophila willistoni TaxID=7260 RepID=B4MQF5_DROWI|nr:juvenile hormone esterase [Drosophila willistoni]EDW74344.1 uncharacterized protein Dwil_GK21864 [Drosophila willistoni]